MKTQPPYADKSPLAAIMLIPKAEPPTVVNPASFSAEFNDLVAKCCTKDYRFRPSAQDLLRVRRFHSNLPLVDTNLKNIPASIHLEV
jgi:serine/threonine protein kinase